MHELNPTTQENFRAGHVHMAWGLALKLIVGDRLAVSATGVFDRPEAYSTIEVYIAMGLQWIHVFCDFYGYSEMARGLAIMFGVKLIRNFVNPFRAHNTRSFWQKWHVSLTRWVFDLYFPMVGRKPSQLRRSVCLVIAMVVIGFWHGASYNFILFGLFHAIIMLIQDQTQKYSPFHLPKPAAIIVNNMIIIISAPLFYGKRLEPRKPSLVFTLHRQSDWRLLNV